MTGKRSALQLFLLLSLPAAALGQEKLPPAKPDDPDGYVSENKAKSVRPPKPRDTLSRKSTQPPPYREDGRDDRGDTKNTKDGNDRKDERKKDDSTRQVFSASDVAAIQAMKGKEIVVRGRVASVYVPKSETVVILNFGPDHKTCFKAVVFKRNFDKFEGGMEGLKKLARKTVTVEGTVSEYDGTPQIQLNVPSQLRTDK